MENKYTKLSELIGKEFTIQSIGSYKWKRWIDTKMQVSDDHFEGAQKKYPVVTDKGQLDLGSGQVGNILESSLHQGKPDPIGKTFSVKSNGRSGMDIRYYLNLVRDPLGSRATVPSQAPETPVETSKHQTGVIETIENKTPHNGSPDENQNPELDSVPF